MRLRDHGAVGVLTVACMLAIGAAFLAGCNEKGKGATREKELEVELAKAKASQAQAEAEKARLEAARAGENPQAATSEHGYLVASTTPWASISIDGVPTGMTPITLQGRIALSPGPHTLSFAVGGETYVYDVKIEAGKTLHFKEDLRAGARREAGNGEYLGMADVRVMTRDETAAHLDRHAADAPSLADLANAGPIWVTPPACEKASAQMKRYAQCSEIDKESRDRNVASFAASLDNPPGGDKAALCAAWLDFMDGNKSSFCM